ncbi:MAG: metallophosphoesterase [Candidatus Nanohalobium sp.]
MKIGIFSDVHSNYEALKAVIRDLERKEIDRFICAGDLIGYYTRPNEVISTIQDKKVISVVGNHDAKLLEMESLFSMTPQARKSLEWNRNRISHNNLNYLKSLPEKMTRNIEGKRIFVTHGSPDKPLEEYVYEKDVSEDLLGDFSENPDIIVLGHTHVPFKKNIGDTIVLNPGSVGQPRDGDSRASYAVLDLEKMEVEHHRVEYDVEKVANEVSDHISPELGKRLRSGK